MGFVNTPGSAGDPFFNAQKVLIGRAKRAPHWGVQSRFRVIYIYMSVCLSCPKNAWAELLGPSTRMLKVRFGRLKPTDDTRVIHFDYKLEQLYSETFN